MLTLSSHCYVTNYVTMIKYTVVWIIFTWGFRNWCKIQVLLNILLYFITDEMISFRWFFTSEVSLEVESVIQIAMSFPYIFSFRPTHQLKNWRSYANFDLLLTFDLVISFYILGQRTCRNQGQVVNWDQVWWWLADSFWDLVKLPYKQTDKQTNRANRHTCQSRKYWQVANTTNQHTCKSIYFGSNKPTQMKT